MIPLDRLEVKPGPLAPGERVKGHGRAEATHTGVGCQFEAWEYG